MENEINRAAEQAVLKHRVNNIEMKVDAIDKKLDELLQLRSKGMGAFWLASLLFGTSLLGFIFTLINWMKA